MFEIDRPLRLNTGTESVNFYPGCDKTISICTSKFSNRSAFGGFPFIQTLAPAFDNLVYIDTTAFMAAVFYQRLIDGNDGLLTKVPLRTAPSEAVSGLLEENIQTMRNRVERGFNESRMIF